MNEAPFATPYARQGTAQAPQRSGPKPVIPAAVVRSLPTFSNSTAPIPNVSGSAQVGPSSRTKAQAALLAQMLAFLFALEYVVLVEYVEAYVPFFYGAYYQREPIHLTVCTANAT